MQARKQFRATSIVRARQRATVYWFDNGPPSDIALISSILVNSAFRRYVYWENRPTPISFDGPTRPSPAPCEAPAIGISGYPRNSSMHRLGDGQSLVRIRLKSKRRQLTNPHTRGEEKDEERRQTACLFPALGGAFSQIEQTWPEVSLSQPASERSNHTLSPR